ncbi:MAG: FAD-dependent oxidoreductase [Bacteroidales bacterium]|nr:FAD-dependent oxidoreductase [Bacteroidales bacterium]
MDRRKFIKSSVVGAAGLAAVPGIFAEEVRAGVILSGAVPTDGKAGAVSNGVENHLKVSSYVREPSHKIPVVASSDVVVVGGGAAGVAAAVCAARGGSSVLLIEKTNYLGGLWTGGLVLPVLATHGKGKNEPWDKAVKGICAEVCDILLDKGWAVNPLNPQVDPEATKYLLDKMIYDAGVRVLYNATAAGVTMSGNRIESVLVDCSTGRLAIKCRMVVDASGDGLVFTWAGDPFEARRYHMTVLGRVGGCPATNESVPIREMRIDSSGTRDAMDGLDIFKVSENQQQGRFELWDKVQKMKKKNGYENAYLMEVAPTTGVRVTRVLDSLHNVTLEDSMEWVEYPDVIGMSGVCDPFMYKGREITRQERPVWQIPYRSLVPRQTQNLLVAGRCFGYDQGITWDAREISTCMVTGQAAGVAASIAVNARCAAKDVDISLLQKKLREAGVRLNF